MSKTHRQAKTADRAASRAARARTDWDNWADWSRDEQIAAAAPGLEAVRTSPRLASDVQWTGFFAARNIAATPDGAAWVAEVRAA